MEISNKLRKKSKGGKVKFEIFRGMDKIFQLEFRTGEIWELINEIFEMWQNIGIKSEKVKNFKPLICPNSKSGLEMKLFPEDMTSTSWRAMQEVKDEKLFKTILSRLKSRELSLDKISEEFLK